MDAVYRESSNGLEMIAREGMTAPGTDGLRYTGFVRPRAVGTTPFYNDNGTVVFGSLVGGSLVAETTGVFVRPSSGPISLVARTGDPAPGLGDDIRIIDRTTFVIDPGPLNDADGFLFSAGLMGEQIDATNSFALFRADSQGEVDLIARNGDPAPGFPPEATIDTVLRHASAVGSVVSARVKSGPNLVHAVYMLEADGSLLPGGRRRSLIAQSGDNLPQVGNRIELLGVTGRVLINNNGSVVFVGSLVGDDVEPQTNNLAILRISTDGTIDAVARQDDLVDNAGGARLGDSIVRRSSLLLNDGGDVVFASDLRGADVIESNDSAIIRVRNGGGLEEIAREGQMAPGAADGVLFGQFGDFSKPGFEGPALASNGRVALEVFLTGNSVDDTNDFALYAEDVRGALQLIAREGDMLDVNDDPDTEDLRVISFLDFIPAGFNDRNQVAFSARFTDGTSGIFVSNLVAVPEPAAFSLVWLSTLVLLASRPGMLKRTC